MNVMVTYDLHDADEEDHEKAMNILLTNGFLRELAGANGGKVPLPQTTVAGTTNWTGDKVRDWVWTSFDQAKVNPKRVAVLKHGEEPSARYKAA